MDHQSEEAHNDLSTKITMIVFWGLVIFGLSFAGIMLHHIEEDTIERRDSIADSVAFKLFTENNHSLHDAAFITAELKNIVDSFDKIGIEVLKDGKTHGYADKHLESENFETIIRPISFSGDKKSSYEVHILFPSLVETIHSKRTLLLMALGSLLLGFGILLKLVLERLLKLPIDEMVNSAKAISSGQVDVLFDEQRPDELGYLAGFFNKAIKNIHEQEQESWHAKELAEITLESISDGVVTTDKDSKVIFMNACAERMTGRLVNNEKGKRLSEVMPLTNEEKNQLFEHPVYRCLEDDVSVDVKTNCVLVTEMGDHLPVSCSVAPIHNSEGDVLGAIMIVHDVSETRDLHRELSYQATHDHLTGLSNRREFESEIQHALTRAKRDDHKHSLCYLDLDQFKVVNDTCGHSAGDMLLRKLSEHLKVALRKTDLFARLGGDEFALLLPHCPLTAAEKVATNVLRTINEFRFVWQDKKFQIGVSIGIAALTAESKDAAEVLSHADMACYAAKETGRNRIHLYEDDDKELRKRREEMSMISSVREALVDNKFELFIQPIVSTRDLNDRSHYEVLIRMRSEDDQVIPPVNFLPAAERYQLMPSIDRWVVSNAMMFMADDSNIDKDFSLAINISAQSINEENFLEHIKDEIIKYDIEPSRLCFEITETEAVNNLEHAIHFIKALRKLKCKFALDDFGTGVSSFEYLKNLPVDFLKIDGSFIKNIDTNKIDYAMVRAINEVASVMSMKTIAEFVENEESYNTLSEIGIDYAQGYWIDKPMPATILNKSNSGSIDLSVPPLKNISHQISN